MQTTPATILGQISAEKTKISERLARLNADRETIATQLTDLEVTERVLTRVGTTSPARTYWRQPRAGTSKSAGRQAGARTASLGERVLALATGKTRRELYAACPGDRPNHVGMAVQRHMRAGRIQEREGKLYAI
jgi:hypothetical protein